MQDVYKEPASNVVRTLCDLLTRRVVAYMVDHKNTDSMIEWMEGESTPTQEEEERLRTAYEIYVRLQQAEGYLTIRAWFLGKNPDMDGDLFERTVVEAIRRGEFSKAKSAARLFRAYG